MRMMSRDIHGRNKLESMLVSIVPRTGEFAVLTSLYAVTMHTIEDCLQTGNVNQNLGTESNKAEGDPQADTGEEDIGRTHADSIDPSVELPLDTIVIRTYTRRLDHKKFVSNGCSSCQKNLDFDGATLHRRLLM